MATLAFTIGGAAAGTALFPGLGTIGGLAVGGMIGSAVGGLAGSFIDSNFLMPALFPMKGIEAGKIRDMELMGGEEGTPIQRCYGPECRVPGQVIFLSDLIEERRTEGGKGGGMQSVTQYKYFCDVAVAVCDRQVLTLKKIWADGKLLYSDETDIEIVSNQISAQRTVIREQKIIGILVAEAFVDLTSPNAGPDLQQLRSGNTCTVSGFTTGLYNGTFKVIGTRYKSDGSTQVRLTKTGVAVTQAAPEAAGETITITQTPTKFDESRLESVTFYQGSATQTANTLLESYEGSGNVPGYRGTSYVVIKRLALEYYGNRLPQFNFLIEADSEITAGETIAELCERSGLESTDYDVDSLSDDLLVRGYVVNGLQTGEEVLGPVLAQHNILVQESNGALRFFLREGQTPRVVLEDDLAAHDEGESAPRPMRIQDMAEHLLPSEMNVQFIDPKLDYQRGSVREPRDDAPFENPATADVPIVMELDAARAIGGRMLWAAWNNRQGVELALPPSYLEIEEGDVVQVPSGARTYEVIVGELTRGHNLIHQVRGYVEDSLEYEPPGSDPATFLRSVSVATPIKLELIDVAPLRDAEKLAPGFYYAVSDADEEEGWNGAVVFTSKDGATFEADKILRQSAIVGEAGLDVTETEEVVDSAAMVGAGWQTIVDATAYGGSYRESRSPGTMLNAEFTSSSGTYDVYLRWTYATDRSDSVQVMVWTGAAWSYRYVNQADPNLGGQWVWLGQFTCSASPYVRVMQTRAALVPLGGSVPQSQATSVSVDAVKILTTSGTGVLDDGPVGYWDRENTVRVRVLDGTLEGRTELEVLNGANHALVGSEVIAFQEATLVNTNTYDLSVLLRGLRGTENLTASHRGAERFVLLDKENIHFVHLNPEDVGNTVYVKAVAPGEDPEDVDATPLLLESNTLTHFAPANLRAEAFTDPLVGYGLRVRWEPRSREIVRVFNKAPWGVSLLDLQGWYWEARTVNGLTKRWITIGTKGANDFTYSNTLQEADGFIASDTIEFRVCALSTDGRRGRFATVTATSTL